ncbi:hypothetical protein DS957_011005 [Vibrio harveyi]|uniref:Uncharacterized protein n=1 Tax=Vibrio harveyi TaxID=669 RepID=A0A8B3ECW0_VIBHA|nr:hypothetical protein DS957_011005 [Vibrio harveyi]
MGYSENDRKIYQFLISCFSGIGKISCFLLLASCFLLLASLSTGVLALLGSFRRRAPLAITDATNIEQSSMWQSVPANNHPTHSASLRKLILLDLCSIGLIKTVSGMKARANGLYVSI